MSNQNDLLCIEQTSTGPRIYLWQRLCLEARSIAASICGPVAWVRGKGYSSLAEALRHHPGISIRLHPPVETERTVASVLEGTGRV